MDKEDFVDMAFPARGVYLASGFHSQLPATTPLGENVRLSESIHHRDRGGSRSGISKWIPGRLPRRTSLLSRAIQHMNTIVTADGTALLGAFDTGDFRDPSSVGQSFLWPPGKKTRNPRHFIRDGGSGVQPYKSMAASLAGATITDAKRYLIARVVGTNNFINQQPLSFVDEGFTLNWNAAPWNGDPPNPILTWRIRRYTTEQIDVPSLFGVLLSTPFAIETVEEIDSGDIGIEVPATIPFPQVVQGAIGANGSSCRVQFTVLEQQSFPGGAYPTALTTAFQNSGFDGPVPAT